METDDIDQRIGMPRSGSDAEIRVEVRREVTGLTSEQLGDLIAAGEDGTALVCSIERHRAAVRMTELKRIRIRMEALETPPGQATESAGDRALRAMGYRRDSQGGGREKRHGALWGCAWCSRPDL